MRNIRLITDNIRVKPNANDEYEESEETNIRSAERMRAEYRIRHVKEEECF